MTVSFRATILDVLSSDEKKKKFTLLLSGGDLHPSGGGQPGDSGSLWTEDFRFQIDDTEKRDGGLAVTGKAEKGSPAPGMEVEGEADLERHRLLSRMHTGEHILSRALEKAHPGLRVFKVAVDSAETSVYLTWDGELDWDVLFEAEKEGNKIVAEDLPVETVMLSKDEAEHLPGIKGNWSRIADETIRVVRIPGYDAIACSGSHVSSTGKVGNLFITAFRGTSPDWEFKFSVDGSVLRQEYSEAARRLVRSIGCRLSQLGRVVGGLQEENGALRKLMERASQYISLPAEDFSAGGLPVSAAVLPGFSRELAAPAARKWSDANPGRVLLLLLPEPEKNEGSFLLYGGKEISVDFSAFLKESPGLRARGGGRSDWLNGLSPVMEVEPWLEALKVYAEKKRP
ncbi:alanyl-tRNA editing protein [Aminivibrio sp.]|uniref:alanyl-tRNA editing protein n=1 Tax=Aminivibrio sp. TaxID=1872489 RepID=UPI001A52E510|nr:alanyl-tRNA editing protein [Aminivibrio sp.]MBL3540550.1 alanyl-tRNA editing protein [Aminivibrio sp.]